MLLSWALYHRVQRSNIRFSTVSLSVAESYFMKIRTITPAILAHAEGPYNYCSASNSGHEQAVSESDIFDSSPKSLV